MKIKEPDDPVMHRLRRSVRSIARAAALGRIRLWVTALLAISCGSGAPAIASAGQPQNRTRRRPLRLLLVVGAIATALGVVAQSALVTAPRRPGSAVLDRYPLSRRGPLVLVARANALAITRLTVAPSSLAASGGRVQLTGVVRAARTCRFSSGSPIKGLPWSRPCSSGKESVTVRVPPNRTSSARRYRFYLTVLGRSEATAKVHVLVVQRARPRTQLPGQTQLAPAITSQPVGRTVSAGSPVTFAAAASGNPAPAVQWQSSANGANWANIPGATSPTYTFTTAATQNGYAFRAMFTNASGSAVSNAATLLVTTSVGVRTVPVITEQPSDQTVTAGQTATFTATAGGTPGPSAEWQSSADGGSSWTDIAGATSTTYAFTAAAGENGNEYRAVFSNGSGSATTNAASLTVETAPQVIEQPGSESVPGGHSASFYADASGNPTPTVQWEVSSDSGLDWNTIDGATSTTYTFSPADASDNGNEYRAVFSDTVGTATTGAATLTVRPLLSSNWAGYQDDKPDTTYSTISADWTVPTVTCSTGATSGAAEWAGIGSTTLVQEGTGVGCEAGTPFYEAWYELYGDSAVNNGYQVTLPTGQYPVSPGDQIDAYVNLDGSVWMLILKDMSQHWTFAKNFANTNPGLTQDGAEAVVEGSPTGNLVDFGAVSFSNVFVSGTVSPGGYEASGTIGYFDPLSIDMVNSASTVRAAPGPITGGGEDFTDTWYAN